VFRKSGSWRQWHSDSVLVQGPVWRNYILVGLVESPDGENILRALLPAVETLLHSEPAANPT
jgi:beta-lactamase class A